MYVRPQAAELRRRLLETRGHIQVVAGPRQVGKTTLVRQVVSALPIPHVYASADEPTLRDRTWMVEQWDMARRLCCDCREGGVLVLDEVQKVQGWSETVKRLWDDDSARDLPLKVVLLGSAPLLVQQGLTESLAGRFEVLRLAHWSLEEMRGAFNWTLDQFLYFGGYPGAATLSGEPERWARYVKDALIETTISRDVLLLTRVDKPALLRRMLELACTYSGQVLSFQKMLGQLQDAGNSTTLAHYLDLLSGAGMVTGLQKYAGERVRRRGSSPKLVVLNTALLTAQSAVTPAEAAADRDFWGRLVESAVGAHLANAAVAGSFDLYYWREGDREVDYVLKSGQRLVAIEVKSGRRRAGMSGMQTFAARFHPTSLLLAGEGGVAIKEFLSTPAEHWLRA